MNKYQGPWTCEECDDMGFRSEYYTFRTPDGVYHILKVWDWDNDLFMDETYLYKTGKK